LKPWPRYVQRWDVDMERPPLEAVPAASASPGAAQDIGHLALSVPASWVETTLLRASELSLWSMMVLTFSEVVARTLFHHSFGLADEIGGYLLIALTFLSLAACHVHKVFHQVEFIQARLSLRDRIRSTIAFDLLCLFCTGVLLWQMSRLVGNSWRSGEMSQNGLDIELWIPQSVVVIGLAGLAWSLLRTLRFGWRWLRGPVQPEVKP
jgi:TRAP-type C4-dicarboxylate transport system permease small subunit